MGVPFRKVSIEAHNARYSFREVSIEAHDGRYPLGKFPLRLKMGDHYGEVRNQPVLMSRQQIREKTVIPSSK